MKKIVTNSVLFSALLVVFSGIISCEKDFTDIGTSIVGNTKFSINDTILEVVVTQRNIDAVRGDNLTTGNTGDFLLGVYQDPNNDYEKIEASFVTQLALASINLTDGATDSTTVTSIFDNAFIKLPYTATKGDNVNGKPTFTIDTQYGITNVGVPVQVYQNNTFLNTLNPQNPAQGNSFSSDFVFEKGTSLTANNSFLFIPNPNDTVYYFNRNSINNVTVKDSLKLANANPFLVIPLDSTKMKALFYDQFGSASFASQEALNNYFRGLIIEATGDENALVPFTTTATLIPTLEVNYSNSVINNVTNVVDTILRKTASFPLSGVKSRLYKMTPEKEIANAEQVVIQGTAGKAAEVKILQGNQLEELKAKDWLINDATLTFYVDNTKDTTAIPTRLFIYKEEPSYSSQIKDAYSEGLDIFSGVLVKEGTTYDRYDFKITDYISDVLGTATLKNSNLVLRVYNTTDIPVQNNALDTIVKSYNWNPRAVTITNHLPSTRKAQLKISYSEKK